MKRLLSMVLSLVMLAGLMPAMVGAPHTEALTVPGTGDASICLETETITLPAGYTVAAYSINAGRTWKNGVLPTGANFSKLFNRELTLWVTNEMNNKVPNESAAIKFNRIEARPKGNIEKLAPNYLPADDAYALMANKRDLPKLSYKYAESASGPWSEYEGSLPIPDGNRKKTYFFYVDCQLNTNNTSIPKGKVFKQTLASRGKAPNVKPDYKKETIRFPKNLEYSVNGGAWTNAEGEISITSYITLGNSTNNSIHIRKKGADKRPASNAQRVLFPNRAILTPRALSVNNGKAESPKDHEVLVGSKWVAISRATRAGEYPIRIKNSARPTTGTDGNVNGTGNSLQGTLTITRGPNDKGKEVIISAVITTS
jgi:hypothetical protein